MVRVALADGLGCCLGPRRGMGISAHPVYPLPPLNSWDACRGVCLVASRIADIRQLPGHQGPTPWGDAPKPIQEDQAIQRLMEVCAQEGLSPTQAVLMHPREYKLVVFRMPATAETGSGPDVQNQAERACDQ